MNDPIVDEVHRVRDAHGARFNYDLDAIFRDIKEREKQSGLRFVQGVASQPPMEQPSGIESTPGVCGGEPCIRRTRITVWLLEQSRRLGMSEAELLANYPTLRAEDLVNAWAYVQANRQEIESQMQDYSHLTSSK